MRWLRAEGREMRVDEEVKRVTSLFSSEKRGHSHISEAVSDLMKAFHERNLHTPMTEYDEHHANEPNYVYWTTYLEMVDILLDFIRANWDGNWELHLAAFAAMLPYLTVYDHTNYAHWGPVYLAEMNGIQRSELYREFTCGNCVIKRSKGRFNQAPPD